MSKYCEMLRNISQSTAYLEQCDNVIGRHVGTHLGRELQTLWHRMDG